MEPFITPQQTWQNCTTQIVNLIYWYIKDVNRNGKQCALLAGNVPPKYHREVATNREWVRAKLDMPHPLNDHEILLKLGWEAVVKQLPTDKMSLGSE